jgi:tetratricopeptide (TPR) repeat protein
MKRKLSLQIASLMFLFSIGLVVSASYAQAQIPTKKQIQQARRFAEEGDKFFKQKNYKMAIDRYDKASALVPNYPAVTYYKGYAHYNLNEFEPAAAAFTKALNQGYTPIEIYKVRWYMYYNLKDYDNAITDLKEVVKVQPNNALLLVSLGDLYREKEQPNEAIESYLKAAVIRPDDADLQYQIAYTYAKAGNTAQQGVYALNAIQKGTRYLGDSWYLVGNAFQANKKYQESAEAFEKAISAKPELTAAYTNLAQMYQNLNRFDDAINILKKGAEVNPNDGNIYISLSWLYSLLDRNKSDCSSPGSSDGIYKFMSRLYGFEAIRYGYFDLQRSIENYSE